MISNPAATALGASPCSLSPLCVRPPVAALPCLPSPAAPPHATSKALDTFRRSRVWKALTHGMDQDIHAVSSLTVVWTGDRALLSPQTLGGARLDEPASARGALLMPNLCTSSQDADEILCRPLNEPPLTNYH